MKGLFFFIKLFTVQQYNMGILFSKESPEVIIKCKELGCVYDYAPDFGVMKKGYTQK